MKKSVLIAGLVILVTAGAALAMGDLYVSYKLHVKTTVVVETPDGLKTGSAVREISNSASSVKIMDFPEAVNPADVKGEAVVVDLGERGVLFTLISDQSASDFYSAFPAPRGGETTVKGIRYYKSLGQGTSAPLPKEQWPKMVTFTDMNDPKSVQLVRGYRFDPQMQKSILENNFEEIFGEGVRLKSITLKITDEPVTWGVVDEYLMWLSTVKKGSLDGRMGTFSNHLSSILHYGNFKRGEK